MHSACRDGGQGWQWLHGHVRGGDEPASICALVLCVPQVVQCAHERIQASNGMSFSVLSATSSCACGATRSAPRTDRRRPREFPFSNVSARAVRAALRPANLPTPVQHRVRIGDQSRAPASSCIACAICACRSAARPSHSRTRASLGSSAMVRASIVAASRLRALRGRDAHPVARASSARCLARAHLWFFGSCATSASASALAASRRSALRSICPRCDAHVGRAATAHPPSPGACSRSSGPARRKVSSMARCSLNRSSASRNRPCRSVCCRATTARWPFRRACHVGRARLHPAAEQRQFAAHRGSARRARPRDSSMHREVVVAVRDFLLPVEVLAIHRRQLQRAVAVLAQPAFRVVERSCCQAT